MDLSTSIQKHHGETVKIILEPDSTGSNPGSHCSHTCRAVDNLLNSSLPVSSTENDDNSAYLTGLVR